ncbi:CDP-glucose 4,6-dehydratase [Methylobacterium aquaticum]|uniref:CDP-glucose 4,6-dehydratase n=1 Tax=Methylobacterium aquaticum TaxID=270351 RepID=UPI003D171DF4
MEKLVTDTGQFWRGRRVFLTGHTGFKGAWLTVLLARFGAEVHGYALAPAEGSIYEKANVGRLLATSTIADIRDLEKMRTAIDACRPEIVLHLAAQPLVRLSYEIPVETFAVNVLGTVHVLDILRGREDVKAAVIVTSDKCYENREWVWGYREDEPMGGYDPYSSSKGCTELVTSAYRRSFFQIRGAQIGSGRAGNVIGGGDVSQDRLIPDIIRTFRAGEPVLIRAPGAIRPWQHVLEPLSGYLALAEALGSEGGAWAADGWNFGPPSEAERTVSDVVETVVRVWGGTASWQQEISKQVHEAGYLKLDSSKARRLLGWQPRWDFERAIEETIAWYRAEDRGEDMLAFTQAQIDAYFNSPSL